MSDPSLDIARRLLEVPVLDTTLAALVSFFLIDPLQAEISKRLEAAGAPPTIVADVAACGRTATPVIVERATSDPWWAATTAAGIWIGSTKPDSVLVDATPACAPALDAAGPFLTSRLM